MSQQIEVEEGLPETNTTLHNNSKVLGCARITYKTKNINMALFVKEKKCEVRSGTCVRSVRRFMVRSRTYLGAESVKINFSEANLPEGQGKTSSVVLPSYQQLPLSKSSYSHRINEILK